MTHKLHRLLAIMLVAMLAASCSEQPEPWTYVASNIPGDASAVVAVNTRQLLGASDNGLLDGYIVPGEARGLLGATSHVLYVRSGSTSFVTWPIADNPQSEEMTSRWQQVRIGSDGPEAHTLATEASVIFATDRQAWLIPGTTDVATSLTMLSQLWNDMHRSDNPIEKSGLNPNPTAMDVIRRCPEQARAYISLNDNPCTVDVATDAKSGETVFTLRRHTAAGADTVLSANILQPDTAVIAEYPDAPLLLTASLRTGTLADNLPQIIAPYLTITQRVIFNTLTSNLRDASGPLTAALQVTDGHCSMIADINFVSAKAAEDAAGKINRLTDGHAPVQVSVRDTTIRLSMPIPLHLPTAVLDAGHLRLIVYPDCAVLTAFTSEDPLNLIGLLVRN